MRLLDAGSGPGSITIGLATAVQGEGGTATGIDASPEAVSAARTLAAERGCANVTFDVADVYGLPFDDRTFDAAFMHAILQHLSDPLAALKEMRRVLKPGAVIGIGDMDFDGYLQHPMTPPLARAQDMMKRLRVHNEGTIDAGRRLRGLLHNAGFAQVKVSVVANCDSTPEAVAATAWWQASYLESPEFGAYVIDQGLATEAELQEMAAAWRAWGADSAAMYTTLAFQALGWAP
jgi:SAM-dependent methyltransferase